MKNWKLLFTLPLVAGLAFVPQDPEPQAPPPPPPAVDPSSIVRASEIQYVDHQGQMHSVSSRTAVEVRLLDGGGPGIRIEILYENGDYSMIDAQAIHVIRSGRDLMDVRLVRAPLERMRFPKLP